MPLYKMLWNKAYSWPSACPDSQPWIKNSISDPQLVESEDVKPMDIEVVTCKLRFITIHIISFNPHNHLLRWDYPVVNGKIQDTVKKVAEEGIKSSFYLTSVF